MTPRSLIIAGTTRAGSTSLFLYLDRHPAVCAANVKETGFFLEDTYPLESRHDFDSSMEAYERFFNHCRGEPVRMEATPDYLYSAVAAERVANHLPKARLVFLLREPVDRLVSWFRFAKQLGWLDDQVTFDEYVDQQLRAVPFATDTRPHMRALEQGRYSHYLPPWQERFESGQILVAQLADLEADAARVVEQVCVHSGVAFDDLPAMEFAAENRSQAVRSPRVNRAYLRARHAGRMWAHDKPRIKRALAMGRRRLEPIYLAANRRSSPALEASADTTATLAAFYADEPARLEAILGVDRFEWRSP